MLETCFVLRMVPIGPMVADFGPLLRSTDDRKGGIRGVTNWPGTAGWIL